MTFISRLLIALSKGNALHNEFDGEFDEYQSLSANERLAAISLVAQSETVPPENGARFFLKTGDIEELRRYVEAADLQGHDRDYLLHVYQSVAGDVERGLCDDPRPLLLRVADIPAACDCRWSHHVYELILDRHPATALLLWRRFLDITSDPDLSAEFVDLWARDSIETVYAPINEERPHEILYALRESGFFADKVATSEWLRSLIRVGSAAALLMVFEILAEANLAAGAIEAVESTFQGLPASLVLVGNASRDGRIASIGSALRLTYARYATRTEPTLAATGVR